MITTKDFKAQNALSDSAFKRLCNKVATVHPDRSLTVRLSGNEWEVLEPDLLLSFIKPKKEESSELVPFAFGAVLEAELVTSEPLEVSELSLLSEAQATAKDLQTQLERLNQTVDLASQFLTAKGNELTKATDNISDTAFQLELATEVLKERLRQQKLLEARETVKRDIATKVAQTGKQELEDLLLSLQQSSLS